MFILRLREKAPLCKTIGSSWLILLNPWNIPELGVINLLPRSFALVLVCIFRSGSYWLLRGLRKINLVGCSFWELKTCELQCSVCDCLKVCNARLVLSRHSFIPFRIGIWEGDQCAQSLLGIFFRPSLDTPRSHQILPINHSAEKRSDWVWVCCQLQNGPMSSGRSAVLSLRFSDSFVPFSPMDRETNPNSILRRHCDILVTTLG